MPTKQISLALCAGLLGLSACAHEGKPRERTSVSAVTNEEAAKDPKEQNRTRMRYTVVDEREALGRNHPNTRGVITDERRAVGTAAGGGASAQDCELAVYFPTDSSELDERSERRLDRVAECIERREIDHALIVGQTDPRGPAERNRELGLERARVVADYLRKRGVPEDEIRVRSKGELAAAESQELWPVERRAGVDVRK